MVYWEIISSVIFFTSIVYFLNRKQLNNSILKWMWLYLLVLFIGDLFVPQISKFIFRGLKYSDANNVFYSTVLVPIGMSYYNYIYYQKFKNTKGRFLSVFTILLYFLVLTFEAIVKYTAQKYNFLDYAYSTGCISLLLVIIYYLYTLTVSDRILDFYNQRFFYISIGIFIFYIIGLPKLLFLHQLRNYSFYSLYEVFVAIFNVLMYGLFSIAAIWGKRD